MACVIQELKYILIIVATSLKDLLFSLDVPQRELRSCNIDNILKHLNENLLYIYIYNMYVI